MTAPSTTGTPQHWVSRSSVSQITTGGQSLEAGKSSRTILEVLTEADPGDPDWEEFHNVRETLGGSPCAAYLHVPFCFHKCHYCDFYSIVDNRDRQGAFVDRLMGELRAASRFFDKPIQTIFVGGGTPTLMSPDSWRLLLPVIRESLPLIDGGEFTIEANPETVTRELVDVLVDGGVNRISIGAQSFNHQHLKTLERWHDPRNVERSVEILRAAGIENFNLDLIFAIPGQTIEDWQSDLEAAIALRPAHLSGYGLMYEPNTPLTVRMKNGQVQPVEQDVEAAMYDAAIDRLSPAGFEHYEISNWARIDESAVEGNRCRHNMLYWTNANWWAFGPSASGHLNGLRWKNVPRLGEYLDHGPFPNIIDVERTSTSQRIGEQFMLGLRLIDGMTHERVDQLLGDDSNVGARKSAIARHKASGLLQSTATHLQLSRRGLMLADTVLSDLV